MDNSNSNSNSTDDKSWVSVPEFGEWDKRKGVFTRDYSGHFAMMRSVRRYRKKLLSWTSIGSGDELAPQSSKPVKNPEHYRHVSDFDAFHNSSQLPPSKPVKHPEHYRHVSDFDAFDNSSRFNNRTRKEPGIARFMRFFICCH